MSYTWAVFLIAATFYYVVSLKAISWDNISSAPMQRMVYVLSDDDTAKIFKYLIRVRDTKKPLHLPFYGNSQEVQFGFVALVVVLAKSRAVQDRCFRMTYELFLAPLFRKNGVETS